MHDTTLLVCDGPILSCKVNVSGNVRLQEQGYSLRHKCVF